MAQTHPAQTSEVNIHLRAREKDREMIDRAAELVGANRSQFMLSSALNEAKRVLLDQTSIVADAQAFQKVLDWMDAEASEEEAAGLTRLLQAQAQAKAPWRKA